MGFGVYGRATPPVHGVAGNEYFIREENRFAAPAPVSFHGLEPTASIYTDGYANELLAVPTVYEQLRAAEPGIHIWVAMSQFYAGADKLLLAAEAVYVDAFEQFVGAVARQDDPVYEVYKALDEEVLEGVLDEGEDQHRQMPHVLTVYLPGLDLFTHQDEEVSSDEARIRFLTEVLDPKFMAIHEYGTRIGALTDRWVIVTADHGHTDVIPENRLLLAEEKGDARAVLERAGFRVRPFVWDIETRSHQAVLAYGGATAYVYLADRTTCVAEDAECDWNAPPRYEQDVLAAAEAFHEANETGRGGAAMKGTLDMILTRKPRPFAEDDLPFEVYVGGGRTQPLARWLEANPRPEYVRFPERMRLLAEGPRGERAGDLLLLTRFGNEERPEDRYYFAGEYRSWHGSPSKRDSEVALMVAHPGKSSEEIRLRVQAVLGEHPTLVDVGKLIVELRGGAPPQGVDGGAQRPVDDED